MSDNFYNRVDPNPGCWIVLIITMTQAPQMELATRSAFPSKKDAEHYMASINSCYQPFLAKIEGGN